VPQDCPRANYLSGFNNKGGAGGKTCIDLFNPPYNGYNYNLNPGSAYEPPTYSWRHTYSGTPTQDEGSCQQLPNGNTLICISFSGYIYEIDSNQTVVWSKQISGTTTNALRYTACYVNGMSVTVTASSGLVCPGTQVQLTATPTGGSSYSYAWTSIPTGYTSTQQNPVVTPTATTSYVVLATSGTCTVSDTVAVTVHPLPPTPTITLTGDSLMSSSSFGNQWVKDGTTIPGATNQYLELSGPGTYQVQVTSSEGCASAMSDPFVYVGLKEVSGELRVSVFPNPTTGSVSISGNALDGRTFTVSVFNSLGARVISVNDDRSPDLSSLEAGLYYLVIRTDRSEYASKKIILIK
jgi:hypothetical protein